MKYLIEEKVFPTRITDFDMHDNFTMHTILDYFQQLATEHAINMGIGYEVLDEQNVHFVVTKIRTTLIKSPKIGDSIKVITYPKEKGRVFFDREYEIRDPKTDELYAIGTSQWVLVQRDTLKIVRANTISYEGNHLDKSSYDIDIPKIDVSHMNFEKVFSYKVLNSDIDRNDHVNNSKYAKIIFDSYKTFDEINIKDIIINFISEVKINSDIDLYKVVEDKVQYFVGKVDGKVCFTARVEGE